MRVWVCDRLPKERKRKSQAQNPFPLWSAGIRIFEFKYLLLLVASCWLCVVMCVALVSSGDDIFYSVNDLLISSICLVIVICLPKC